MRVFYTPTDYDSETVIPGPQSPVSLTKEPEVGNVPKIRIPIIERVNTVPDWEQALLEVKEAGICGIDLETTGLDPLVSRIRLVQLAIPAKAYVADLSAIGPVTLEDLGKLMEDREVKKVGHNLKFDLSFIQASYSRRLNVANIFDTMLASQVSWAGFYELKPTKRAAKNPFKKVNPSHTLKALAKRHLGIDLEKEYQASDWSGDLSVEQITYAGMDAAVLLPLYDVLSELLRKNGLEEVAELEFRALPAVMELELQGLPLDGGATRAMLEKEKAKVQVIAHDLQAEAQCNGFIPMQKKGKKPSDLLNPDSPQDILAYLRGQNYEISSTCEEEIKNLAWFGCAFADKLLQYRRQSHQVAFLKDWLLKLHPLDGRLHPTYLQLHAATGRFSSRRPNAQQVPKRGDDGIAIRKLFKAPAGKKLVKADFSGIELRIMACLSGDKTMLEAFQQRQDLHKLTASKISGLPIEQITKAQRQGAKAVNFLLIYGGQPELLQRRAKDTYGVDMTLEQAQEAHKKFFKTYPGVEAWHRKQRYSKKCFYLHHFHDVEHGFFARHLVMSKTVAGRRRVWPWFGGRTQATVNQLYNSPSQGTGADLLKVVMKDVYSTLPEEVKLVGCVHDELILEVPESMADEIALELKAIMERVGSELLAPVPVEAEVEVLDTWGG